MFGINKNSLLSFLRLKSDSQLFYDFLLKIYDKAILENELDGEEYNKYKMFNDSMMANSFYYKTIQDIFNNVTFSKSEKRFHIVNFIYQDTVEDFTKQKSVNNNLDLTNYLSVKRSFFYKNLPTYLFVTFKKKQIPHKFYCLKYMLIHELYPKERIYGKKFPKLKDFLKHIENEERINSKSFYAEYKKKRKENKERLIKELEPFLIDELKDQLRSTFPECLKFIE